MMKVSESQDGFDVGRKICLTWTRLKLITAMCILIAVSKSWAQILTFPLDHSGHQNTAGVFLQWTGEYQTYDVYLGTDSSALNLLLSNDSLLYVNTGPLNTGRTYYWKVVGHVGFGTPDTSTVRSFSTGDINLDCTRFAPAEDSLVYDTEMDSRYVDFTKHINLAHSALIVVDFWESEGPGVANTASLIDLAHRHNIPVIHALNGGPLNHRVTIQPGDIVKDLIDSTLIQRNITTLIYAGFGSGDCVTLSRPNSINTITMANPGVFDIIFVKDCTNGWPWLNMWNVNSVETRWQTTTLTNVLQAFGETASVEQVSIEQDDDVGLPITENFGTNLTTNRAALVLVNIWNWQENDGWLERIKENTRTKILPLIRFAKSRGFRIIHIPNGRPIDTLCTLDPSDTVITTKANFWAYLRQNGIDSIIVAGNFNNDLNSIFPVIDGWGFTFEGGIAGFGWWKAGGKTSFVQDCITVFEMPGTLEHQQLKKFFLARQIREPGTGTLGPTNCVTTLAILRQNANRNPVFTIAQPINAVEDSLWVGQVKATDPDSSIFGDFVRYRIVGGGTWLSIDSLSGELRGTPQLENLSDTLVTVEAHDNLGSLATQNLSINIHARPPLPIQLASFTAVVTGGNRARLDWITISELGNYGFEVQKSVDQTSGYQSIPNVFIPGHGTTLEPQHYSFTDSAVGSGSWWYRLKQIDLGGTFTYSDGVRVQILAGVKEEEIPTVFSLSQNYPNPWNPSTTIRYGLPNNSPVELTLYNVLGQKVVQLVDQQQQRGYHEILLDGNGLASGTYFYRLQAGNFVQMKKLLLLR